MSKIKSRLSIMQHKPIILSGIKTDFPNIDDDSDSSFELDFFGNNTDKTRLKSIKLASRNLLQSVSNDFTPKFEEKYILMEKLGEGMHSQVFKCY
jgi:hypothetical protein